MTTKPIVSSTMRIFGTQFEKNEDQAPRVYRIEKSFATVHFDVGAKGQIVFLPEGSELCIVGASRLAGCFEVLCGEQLYNIFKLFIEFICDELECNLAQCTFIFFL